MANSFPYNICPAGIAPIETVPITAKILPSMFDGITVCSIVDNEIFIIEQIAVIGTTKIQSAIIRGKLVSNSPKKYGDTIPAISPTNTVQVNIPITNIFSNFNFLFIMPTKIVTKFYMP